jgi:LmbE family N-acetylglucosaminyl deacetylase
MLLETELVPYSLSVPPGDRVLVLAPHPDDETLGMGGSLRLLTESGKKVKVVILTTGEKADPKVTDKQEYSSTRKKEALKAFRHLGVKDYEFLGFPDRELISHRDKVEEIINTIVSDFAPDVIYSPSLIELNPDHRMAAELSHELSRREKAVRCVFYEITTPVRPNILIDITKTFKWKKKAMKCYKSQMKILDYLGLMEAMSTYRTFTLGKGVRFAEAFWELRNTSARQDIRMWLSYEMPLVVNSTQRM